MHRKKDKNITYFARTNFRNRNQLFGIRNDNGDRDFHVALFGKTNTGKTTTMETFIRTDMDRGAGMTIFDVHGDLIKSVFANVPEHRINDLVYLDIPNANNTIGYNPLRKVSYEKRGLVATSILEIFERLNDSKSWGPKLSHILLNCLLLLLDQKEQTTLRDVLRLFREKEFRRRCIKQVVSDDVREFWEKEFPNYSPKFDLIPVYNKLQGFLSLPALRRVLVDNAQNNISLREIQDHQKILLVNLSKGELGIAGTRLIGSLLLTSIMSAAFSRIDTPIEKRKKHFVYLDEAHNFANNLSLASMLEELRKMGLSLFLSLQYVNQVDPQVRDAIFGNVGTIISFRVSHDSARFLHSELHKEHNNLEPGDYVLLPRFHIYLRLMIDGTPSRVFSAVTLRYEDLPP